MTSQFLFPRTAMRHASRGISLIFAMITVLALSLAAVALVRSVDTGTLVLGNLSFKQDTILASDEASRQAIEWIASHIGDAVLQNDSTTNGYYASDKAAFDPTSTNTASLRWVDWTSNGCSGLTSTVSDKCLTPSSSITLPNGVTAKYIILRLCNGPGDPFASGSTLVCAVPLKSGTGKSSEHNEVNYAQSGYPTVPGLANYFRIIVRTEGGRKTVSYVDTVAHF